MIKYTPTNSFHPQLNSELQKIKRHIDSIDALNGPVTIYSGPLLAPGPALTVNGNPAGPGGGIMSQVTLANLYQAYFGRNFSNNAVAGCLIECGNDTVGREIVLYNVSTTWAGVFLVGGPAGEQCGLYSPFAKPMCFGVGNNVGFVITAANKLQGQGPIAGALVDVTPDAGTATLTLTGCTTSPTGTLVWTRVGNLVIAVLPSVTGTSNATSCTLTGLPAAIQPVRNMIDSIPAGAFNDNSAVLNTVQLLISGGSGTLTFRVNGSATGFTAAGTKGLASAIVVKWLLN